MIDVGETVRIHCVGCLDDGSYFCDSRKAGHPIEFVVGSHTLLPALEEAVCSMDPGMARTIRVPAKRGYGAYDEDLVEAVPKADFPGWDQLPVGEYIEMNTAVGPLRVKVASVDDKVVRFDHNHELAGQDLTFEVELVEVVRPDALAQEAHAANCGCGCQRLKESLQS